MNEVLHANIFFAIASVATIVFSLLLTIAIYHIVKILRSFRRIIERLETGSEAIAEDVANFRSLVASGGFFSKAMAFMMGARSGTVKKKQDKD